MDKIVVPEFVKDKKFQWALTGVLLVIILFMSSSIRLSNWDLLTDSTTGEKIPIALDPYYFLRVAETIVATDGNMPEFDEMRIPGFNTKWHPEIMPRVVVWMWQASGVFGDYSLRAVNIFSPVLFFGIGLILFFFLVYVLTNSKFAAVLASAFLAFTPAYLYRTMAGFSDHEAIGMVAFFATMLAFSLSFKYLNKLKKKDYVRVGLFGILVGFLSAFTIVGWGGVAVFIFMIIPIAFLFLWIAKLQDRKNIVGDVGILYYVCWMVSSVASAVLIFGSGFKDIVGGYLLSSTDIIGVIVLAFILIDRLLIFLEKKIDLDFYNEKYRMVYSLGALMLAGIFVLPMIGKNFFGLLWEIVNKLINPIWNTERLTTTVAENAQPYLMDWISSTGKPLFFLFVLGIVLIGIEFAKSVKSRNGRVLIFLGFISMMFGILFSRISPSSILNGAGIFTLSGLIYLGGIAFFAYAFFRCYSREDININSLVLILFSWMFVMLITGRATTRLFFAIAPFMCLSAAYAIIELYRLYRGKKLDEIVKILVVAFLIISLVLSGMIINSSYEVSSNQAQYTGPSANGQWQNAMAWVRQNTNEDAVFVHWWDYGYWVQTLGERATVADGGHAQGIYDGDHKIGRYVLTTPYPETALSFFKTMDVDYLLIDQTDLGKYGAYSKIGGGDGKDELDRYAGIPVMLADPKQMRETSTGRVVVYSGGSYIFEDIVYSDGNRSIFLPARKAAVGGILARVENGSLKQPEAVYIYNNIQTSIPIRYVYFNGEIIDYGSGLDAVIDIIPSFSGNSVDQMGAAIYLSQKVSRSLFARLFLMDDVFNEYETIELAYIEDDQVVKALRAQGVSLSGDFIFYNGFRGPIKIWNTEVIPEEIKIVPEFKEPFSGTFGALDDLQFSY
ncbi:MAG: hypothetical protein KJ592_02385 [Nanoarchaeota archaeon]|nr:hypothetical protein [Nanoarchaeota archaeon]